MTNEKLNISWLVFHLFQVGVFQFYAAPRFSHFAYKTLERRNPEATRAIMQGQQQVHPSWLDYLIGALSAGLLIYGVMSMNTQLYWIGKYLSVGGLLFTCLLLDNLLVSRFRKSVPPSAKRTATLTPRALGRIVPLWAWGAYGFISLLIISMTISKSKLGSASLVIFFVAAGIISEKGAKVADPVDDDIFRRSEVWTIFLIACSLSVILPLKAYLDHTEMEAVISSLPLFVFLWFLNSPIYKKLVA
jgi:hypothetical protein